MNADENRVRQRAHEIWEREGRPEGRDREHWEQAEAEIRAEEGAKQAKKPKKGNGAETAEKPAKKAAAPKAAEDKPAAKASAEKAPARKQAAKTTGTAAKPKSASKAG